MKLTKLQRHTAYIIMLSEVEHLEKGNYDCFLCHVFNGLLDMWNGSIWIMNTLPELSKYEPIETDNSGGWFPEDEYKKRKNILKKCIEETA